MSYVLERFDGVDLPQYDFDIDNGTGPSQDGTIVLPGGGVYDPWGEEEAPRDKTIITHTGAVIEDSGADLTDTVRALRAKRGDVGRLWRRWVTDAGSEVEWCQARLLAITGKKDRSEPFRQILNFAWVMESPMWYGEHHGPWTLDSGIDLDSGYYLDSGSITTTLTGSPQTVNITNGGNGRVEDAIITITAGSSAITTLSVTIAGRVAFTFNASIPSGQALVINAGNWSVKKNGVDAWGNFTLSGTHYENSILPLLPGVNALVVVYSGGGTGSTIALSFSDGWE